MGTYVGPPPGSASYKNLTAAGSTLVKTGIGQLIAVVVGTGVASSSIELFDGTTGSGTQITTINTANPGYYSFGAQFNTGLYATVSGTPNITLIYN